MHEPFGTPGRPQAGIGETAEPFQNVWRSECCEPALRFRAEIWIGVASFCRETGKRLLRNELTPIIGDRAHVSLQ